MSDHARDVLVIIPAYNEEHCIGRVVRGVMQALPGADIVVIDDGSKDHTGEVAAGAGAKVLRLPFNIGYGGALQTGYKYAVQKGQKHVVQLDGDGQHDPTCIVDLLHVIESGQADVALGSRQLHAARYEAGAARRVGMWLFSFVASMVMGQAITDPTSGFQALNYPVVKFLSMNVYPVDYPDADVLIMLHRVGFRIQEVPVIMQVAETGKSMHSGLRPFFYVVKMLLSIAVTCLRSEEVE